MKKKLLSFLMVLLLAATVFSPAIFATTAPAVTSDATLFTVSTPSNKTPEVTAGSYLVETFTFTPVGSQTIQAIDIETSTDLAVFPFSVDKLDYRQTGTTSFTFNMRCRGDATQGYYQIPFKIEYTEGTGDVKVATVHVDILVTQSGNSGGTVSNVPKIIISAFSTSPSEVVAGDEFTLSVTFRNTSSSASPTNIKAQLTSDGGTFSPVSGSSTLFMDTLAPGGTATKTIRLKAKADVTPGSYTVTFNINYDVAGIKDPITDTEVLSLPVKQVPRVQVSQIQSYPSDGIMVGQELNIMVNVNNTGKSNLYNTSVRFTDPNGVFADQEQFLGNIQPGSTGAVDIYVPTLMAGEGSITMTITYEDETGKAYTYTDSLSIYVMERGNTGPDIIDPLPVNPTGIGRLWWLLLIPVIGAALLAFLLIRRKKRAKAKLEADRQKVAELEALYMDEQQAQMSGNENSTMEFHVPPSEDASK